MIYEIELWGFDRKEDAVDGATRQTFYVSTDETNPQNIITKCIAENEVFGVRWNPTLSKVVRCVNDCSSAGSDYSTFITHEIRCKSCKRSFKGSTHAEALKAWSRHITECKK